MKGNRDSLPTTGSNIDTIAFAAKIKAQYPEYNDIADKELVQRVLDKYPDYATGFNNSAIITPKSANEVSNNYKGGILWIGIIFIVFSVAYFNRKKFKYLIIRRNKEIAIFMIALIMLLFATNPTRSDFASFMHRAENKEIGRDRNYFIFSIYSFRDHNRSSERYFAVLGNFYELD